MGVKELVEQMQSNRKERRTTRPERMFLAGCANKVVRRNFRKTVLNTVPEFEYRDLTDADVQGDARIWGVEDGKILRPTWNQVKEGDFVLFYTGDYPVRNVPQGTLEYAAKVMDKKKNMELSKSLWREYRGSGGLGSTERGPWPLVIFLGELIEIQLDHEELKQIGDFGDDWNPQRFSTYLPETKIRSEYGSISEFVQAYRTD